mmetsp:Transcript_18224/g.18288  ORF Transcript_18224/g.18288 Transcript_18224/m.18288 type:complete len:183 (+) Transcript_18224:461-1009(+)
MVDTREEVVGDMLLEEDHQVVVGVCVTHSREVNVIVAILADLCILWIVEMVDMEVHQPIINPAVYAMLSREVNALEEISADSLMTVGKQHPTTGVVEEEEEVHVMRFKEENVNVETLASSRMRWPILVPMLRDIKFFFSMLRNIYGSIIHVDRFSWKASLVHIQNILISGFSCFFSSQDSQW